MKLDEAEGLQNMLAVRGQVKLVCTGHFDAWTASAGIKVGQEVTLTGLFRSGKEVDRLENMDPALELLETSLLLSYIDFEVANDD